MERDRDWTWKRIHEYIACLNCGFINESRIDYEKRGNLRLKNVKCTRCQHDFQIQKEKKATFGPLIEQD